MTKERYFEKKKGLPGILRNIFLFLTYPFRHWGFLLFVLVVLAILYCVPVYWYKVPRAQIFDWYKGKVVQLQQMKITDKEKKGTDELIYSKSPAVSSIGRREFGQAAGGEIQSVDVLSQEVEDVVEFVSEVGVDNEQVASSNVVQTEEKVEAVQEKVVEKIEQTKQPKQVEKEGFKYKSCEYK